MSAIIMLIPIRQKDSTGIEHYTEKKKYYAVEIGIFIVALVVLRNAWVLTLPFSILVFDQLILRKKIYFKSLINSSNLSEDVPKP